MQNDEGTGGTTSTPVQIRVRNAQLFPLRFYFARGGKDLSLIDAKATCMLHIQVNDVDLAEVLGGEVAHSNYYSGNGEPYVLILKFKKNTTKPGTYSDKD